ILSLLPPGSLPLAESRAGVYLEMRSKPRGRHKLAHCPEGGMNDRCPLGGSFGIDFDGGFCLVRVVSRIRPLSDETRETREPLGDPQCLEVLRKDLIGGKTPGI